MPTSTVATKQLRRHVSKINYSATRYSEKRKNYLWHKTESGIDVLLTIWIYAEIIKHNSIEDILHKPPRKLGVEKKGLLAFIKLWQPKGVEEYERAMGKKLTGKTLMVTFWQYAQR